MLTLVKKYFSKVFRCVRFLYNEMLSDKEKLL
nr:helix-turn-helix domain-containing protein [Borreliella tanukii]WKC80289.1 helix-turn-helix domain-containing protein [Borreliella tanukii]WKC81201.1 helix-turn-helix domain-containing protein [Borreliella tanukii]